MTPEAQNIAIAESLGWAEIKEFFNNNFDHPNDYRDEIRGLSPSGCREEIHEYTASLDACAEFEAKLTEDQQRHYAWFLIQVSDPTEQFRIWQSIDELSTWVMGLADCLTCARASAKNRCEAYLRTLNLWQESK